jgi:hypothetical protein
MTACASSADAPSDVPAEGEVASSEGEIRASCSNPRKYFATFHKGAGTCTPIEGQRGRWLPEPLFTDAPADVQASTCAYRWSGERNARPDRDAIVSKVGFWNGLAPACGASGSTPSVGLLQPIPKIDHWTSAGTVGCDVCGVVRQGKIWVVLPPETVVRNQFAVKLTDGTTSSFEIEAPATRALSIELPPPPPGTSYESGPVAVF